MNWYKLSQEIATYMGIGHPRSSEDRNDDEEKTIALWVSDLRGNDFQIERVPHNAYMASHNDFFKINPEMNYQGRYDPFKNIVSVVLPIKSHYGSLSTGPDDIPNNLIKRLMSEFQGASIFAFPYFDVNRKGSAIQII